MTEPGRTHPRTREICGTMEVHRRLLNQSISYGERRALIENRALAYEQGARSAARSGVLTIPVVVHVVHNPADPAQDIGEPQIRSEIDVLNEDFRGTNPDASGVPPVWKALVADSRIEFALATVDPDGKVTNGITRTPTSATSFTTSADDVKSTGTGGADPWPSDDYLNIWVCEDIRDGFDRAILGYAQFPGGPPSTDGVVIINSCFGTEGTARAPFDLGRTATHEIGHWLDLRHIWGDDAGSCSGSDFVADTPNQADSNFGKPTFPHVSCNNGPDGDMFVNYMDYTDDAAMFMFTLGQSKRMDACLDGARASFLTAQGPLDVATGTGTAGSAHLDAAQVNGDIQRLGKEIAQLRDENLRLTTVMDGVLAMIGEARSPHGG